MSTTVSRRGFLGAALAAGVLPATSLGQKRLVAGTRTLEVNGPISSMGTLQIGSAATDLLKLDAASTATTRTAVTIMAVLLRHQDRAVTAVVCKAGVEPVAVGIVLAVGAADAAPSSLEVMVERATALLPESISRLSRFKSARSSAAC